MTLVELSADLSVACYLVSYWLACSPKEPRVRDRLSKKQQARLIYLRSNFIYALGAIVMVIHIALAYGVEHQWSHVAALEHTAEETEAVVGFAFSSGLYANFLFAFVYAMDAIWRFNVGQPSSRRPRALRYMSDAFLFSMVLMATVVFEDGWVRWATAAGILAIAIKATASRDKAEHPSDRKH